VLITLLQILKNFELINYKVITIFSFRSLSLGCGLLLVQTVNGLDLARSIICTGEDSSESRARVGKRRVWVLTFPKLERKSSSESSE